MGELVSCPLPTILHGAAGPAQGSSSDIMAELAEAYRCDLCWTVGQVPDTGVGGPGGIQMTISPPTAIPQTVAYLKMLSTARLHPLLLPRKRVEAHACFVQFVYLNFQLLFLNTDNFVTVFFLDVSIIEFRRNRRGLHICASVQVKEVARMGVRETILSEVVNE